MTQYGEPNTYVIVGLKDGRRITGFLHYDEEMRPVVTSRELVVLAEADEMELSGNKYNIVAVGRRQGNGAIVGYQL